VSYYKSIYIGLIPSDTEATKKFLLIKKENEAMRAENDGLRSRLNKIEQARNRSKENLPGYTK
jgi:regulator of replication initiation timing